MNVSNSLAIYPYSTPFELSRRVTFMAMNITLTFVIYGRNTHKDTSNDVIVGWRDSAKEPRDRGGVIIYGFYLDYHAAYSYMLSKGLTAETAYKSINNSKSFYDLCSHGLILRR